MGLLTFGLNVTFDGCYDHREMIADDELHDYFTQLIGGAGALLYGRTTYELMESYWPAVARDENAPRAEREWARTLERIAHRHLDRGVAEQLLNRLERRPAHHEVRSEGVPQQLVMKTHPHDHAIRDGNRIFGTEDLTPGSLVADQGSKPTACIEVLAALNKKLLPAVGEMPDARRLFRGELHFFKRLQAGPGMQAAPFPAPPIPSPA